MSRRGGLSVSTFCSQGGGRRSSALRSRDDRVDRLGVASLMGWMFAPMTRAAAAGPMARTNRRWQPRHRRHLRPILSASSPAAPLVRIRPTPRRDHTDEAVGLARDIVHHQLLGEPEVRVEALSVAARDGDANAWHITGWPGSEADARSDATVDELQLSQLCRRGSRSPDVRSACPASHDRATRPSWPPLGEIARRPSTLHAVATSAVVSVTNRTGGLASFAPNTTR